MWARTAREQAARLPPDWRHHRELRHNAILHTPHIESLLDHLRPGMRVLELGCGPGWLTLAMAQRGALARGVDIAEGAIAIAREHCERLKTEMSGQATYEVADINTIVLPEARFDLGVAKGILHHLLAPDRMVDEVHRALLPGGLFWASDEHADPLVATALLAGTLLAILPTELSYGAKVRALFRVGLSAPRRVQASMRADRLSPLESAGRFRGWLGRLEERFEIVRRIDHPALTGYLAHQLSLPEFTARVLLRGIRCLDDMFVRARLLSSTAVTIYARKRGPARPDP